MAHKYVWLNVATGEFSNSWDEQDLKNAGGVLRLLHPDTHSSEWKLIKFECISDPEFEFHHLMRIK